MSKLTEEINNLLQTFKKLRDPSQGCPWDKEQDFKSIASCSIEEAYEVADAIEREDFNDLKEELGDLFFQIIFHSGMACLLYTSPSPRDWTISRMPSSA